MNSRKYLLIALAILSGLFGLAKSSPAANWYVDKDATGADDGTSWSNAWTWFDKIQWGTSCPEAKVCPGDSIFISGGSVSKTYTAATSPMFTNIGSGTSSNRITIATGAKAPFTGGHDGLVIFDGNDTYGNIINGIGIKYVTFDGERNGQINWKIQNGPKRQRDPSEPGLSDWYGSKGLHVRYMEFSAAAQGPNFTAANPDCLAIDVIEFDHNYVHDIRDDFAIRALGICANHVTWDGMLVHHNIVNPNLYSFSDGSGPDGIQTTGAMTIYNNTFEGKLGSLVYAPGHGQHSDLLQLLGDHNKVYNNFLFNPGNACVEHGANDVTTGYFHFWNNICAETANNGSGLQRGLEMEFGDMYHGPGIVQNVTDVHIFNNTFVDLNDFYAVAIALNSVNQIVTDLQIKNNIFYNTGRSGGFEVIRLSDANYLCGVGVAIDHNLINAGSGGGTNVTCDGSSYNPTNTQTSVPFFTSYLPKTATNDFRLSASDTAAKDYGVDLSSYFNTDKEDAARPQGPAWDIGAYEYVQTGDTTPPAAPTGLVVR